MCRMARFCKTINLFKEVLEALDQMIQQYDTWGRLSVWYKVLKIIRGIECFSFESIPTDFEILFEMELILSDQERLEWM